MSAQPQTTTPRVHAPGLLDHPVPALLLGLVIGYMALCAITVDLTTSQSMFLIASVAVDIAPHFSILAQPVDFFQGHMKGLMAEAFVYSWGIEVFQFMFSTGFVFMVHKHNRAWSWICALGGILIMALNAIANWKYNAAANGWQQAGFTLVLFFATFGLLYAALYLIVVKGFLGALREWFHIHI